MFKVTSEHFPIGLMSASWLKSWTLSVFVSQSFPWLVLIYCMKPLRLKICSPLNVTRAYERFWSVLWELCYYLLFCIPLCRLFTANTFDVISGDAFMGLPHLEYLWVGKFMTQESWSILNVWDIDIDIALTKLHLWPITGS